MKLSISEATQYNLKNIPGRLAAWSHEYGQEKSVIFIP